MREQLCAARQTLERVRWTLDLSQNEDAKKALDVAENAMLEAFFALNVRELRDAALAARLPGECFRWRPEREEQFVFLGRARSGLYRTQVIYDLYLVNGADHQTIFARFGNGAGEYESMSAKIIRRSLTEVNLANAVQGPLLTAFLVALERNLLT